MKQLIPYIVSILILSGSVLYAQKQWWKHLKTGILTPGNYNSITDVSGVQVGQVTLINGNDCRTGVTVVLPHSGNLFLHKVPAAVFVANGYGKLIGFTQVRELGLIETPVVLTNTLSVAVAAKALIEYTLALPGNREVRSINPLVGETNDGFLNDIRQGFVMEHHILDAIRQADSGPVAEGNVGAGTGTRSFGFKGGIGSSSRILPKSLGGYTVGVLVQTNFGGILRINGAPVGEELNQYYLRNEIEPVHDGSCMIVLATDAPLNARQLYRLSKRAFQGVVRSGGLSTHGSGDYVIAFSADPPLFYKYSFDSTTVKKLILRDEQLSPLFLAAAEATEEAIYHSLFAAEDMTGYRGNRLLSLPGKKVINILKKYSLYQLREGS